jgi:hypothetical protein
MEVTRFVAEDGQSVWEKNELHSACIKSKVDTFDPKTGFVAETTHMTWVKARSVELVEKTITNVIKMLKAGTLVPYKTFSTTPMYPGQDEDINPSTGVALGRYSESQLGTPTEALEMDRKFIEIADVNIPVQIEAEA